MRIKYVFWIYLFSVSVFAQSIDIIDSRLKDNWTTIRYIKSNGEVCTLNIKITDLDRESYIDKWFSKVQKTNCNTGKFYRKNERDRLGVDVSNSK